MGSLWVAQSKDGVRRPSVKRLRGRGQCIFQNGFKISCIYVYLQISDGCLIAFPLDCERQTRSLRMPINAPSKGSEGCTVSVRTGSKKHLPGRPASARGAPRKDHLRGLGSLLLPWEKQ